MWVSNSARRGLHALCLEITVQLGRGLRLSRLGTVVMLRRGLHALCLGIYSAVGMQASTLAS